MRVLVALLSLLVVLVGCRGGGGGGDGRGGGKGKASASGRGGRGEGPSYPVDVYAVAQKRIEYDVTAPGTLAAQERVQITARVSGGVDKVAFSEGQTVKKGDQLVLIDAERYGAAAGAASATVEKAKAALAEAESMVKRREKATEKSPGLIPGEEIESLKTRILTAKADLALASSNLYAAQINLRDSSVRAPMDGIIQTRSVDTGQYVQPGTVLATLLFTEPLLLRFQVSPLEAPRIKPGMSATFKLRETTRVFDAKVTLIAASADPDSRMVPVTAEVLPSDHTYFLRPGSFCDVSVPVGGARDVVVVPRAATRPTERGFVAYVVDGEVVRERVLTLGLNTSDGWVEVRQGLAVGDRLVLRGTEPLTDGARVRVTDVPAPTSTAFIATSGAPVAPTATPTATPTASASAGAP